MSVNSSWNGRALSVIRRYVVTILIILIFTSINARALTPAVNSTHFLIYDLANLSGGAV
ncbi:hypothetical protein [Vulcanisaeta distributa]|uniref:hypothetical protein n=1 Tax=Vulcanisaeta distributa TaxID=164451 RepID=UPI001FB51316|nr:hypothetical protein [Vulcanisaeta distributa]